MDTKKLWEIVDKNVNQEQLGADLLKEFMIPTIKKFVADSANPYDDKLVEMLIAFLDKK